MSVTRLQFGVVSFFVLLCSSLMVQQWINIASAHSRLFLEGSAIPNLPLVWLSVPLTMWDQRLSWQVGGEVCWVLMTVFGILVGLFARTSKLRWLPILALAGLLSALFWHEGRMNPVGSTGYWIKWSWDIAKIGLMTFFGLAIDQLLRKRLQVQNEE